MNYGKLFFLQKLDHLPLYTLQRCMKLYRGNPMVLNRYAKPVSFSISITMAGELSTVNKITE